MRNYFCGLHVRVQNMEAPSASSFFFFFNDTATTEIYTLSLHDALPISTRRCRGASGGLPDLALDPIVPLLLQLDRKSTRLNSSHSQISYAVFCLKKKKIPPASTHTGAQIHGPTVPSPAIILRDCLASDR